MVNPVFLVLAIIAKLPVGAPVSVWEVALLGKSNKQIATYVPLAVLWIAVIAERRGTLQKMWAMIKRLMAEVWREISTKNERNSRTDPYAPFGYLQVSR